MLLFVLQVRQVQLHWCECIEADNTENWVSWKDTQAAVYQALQAEKRNLLQIGEPREPIFAVTKVCLRHW